MRIPGQIQISFSPEGVGGDGGGAASAAPAASTSSAPSDGGGAGSSSAPSPSPTPSSPSSAPSSSPTPASAAPTPSSGHIEFPNLDDDLDFLEVPPELPAEPAVPEVPVALAPPPPAAPQAPPAPPVQGQQAAPPPARPASATPHPAEPGAFADQLASPENRAALIGALAAEHFALSPAEVEALELNAVEAVPRLLARTFLTAQESMLRQLQTAVPAMIERHQALQTARTQSEDGFYKQFPQIDKATHNDLVMRTARTYRQMNPTATREQMYSDVGVMVMQMAKIAPAAPQPSPVAMPPASPFRPVAQSAPSAPPSQPAASPWEGMGHQFDED